MTTQRRLVLAALAAAGGWAASGVGAASSTQDAEPQGPATNTATTVSISPSGFGGEKAVSQASYDVVMAFSFPAQIKEVLVKDGDSVKAGTLLVRARDDEILEAIKAQKLQADSELEIQGAEKLLELAVLEFDSYAKAGAGVGTSKIEYDRARLNADTRKIQLDLAKQSRQEKQIRYQQSLAEAERYLLSAKVDGIVEQVRVKVGQAVNDSEPVLRVVSVDPLVIDVPAPTELTITAGVKPGSKAWVYQELVPGQPRVRIGKVVSVASVADAASNTRRVRVEVPNPDRSPPGTQVWVRFDEPPEAYRPLIDAGVALAREEAP